MAGPRWRPRVVGIRPGVLLRLARAGSRVDLLRVTLTAFSALLATLAVLAALTVLAIRTADDVGFDAGVPVPPYSSQLLWEPGLRPGVAAALALLMIPILALAAQCSRLGAPARERRLGALRLAGATPGQVVAVAVAETGLASAAGAGAGLLVFLAGRVLLHRPGPDGVLALPTDVLPAVPAILLAVLAVPVIAAVLTAALLRRVTVTPFGVVRRAPRSHGPRAWPGLLVVLPGGLAFGLPPLLRWIDERVPGGLAVLGPVPEWAYHHAPRLLGRYVPPLLVVGVALTAVGLVAGTGWLSYATGRLLHRLARRPAPLLAARRLLADPWQNSRTMAAVLACVLVGGGAVGMRASFATTLAARVEIRRQVAAATGEPIEISPTDRFYLDAMDVVNLAVTVALVIAVLGLLAAVAEGIVARRRSYAALVATGVPRAVLSRSIVWQTLLPAAPAVVLAGLTGLMLVRGLGTRVREGGATVCTAGEAVCADPVAGVPFVRTIGPLDWSVPVPVGDLAVLCAGTIGAVLLVVLLGLTLLRPSTDPAELRTS